MPKPEHTFHGTRAKVRTVVVSKPVKAKVHNPVVLKFTCGHIVEVSGALKTDKNHSLSPAIPCRECRDNNTPPQQEETKKLNNWEKAALWFFGAVIGVCLAKVVLSYFN